MPVCLEIKRILNGDSKKKLFIIGPCSIHNIDEALEYGKLLKKISEKVKDEMIKEKKELHNSITICWKELGIETKTGNTLSQEINKRKSQYLVPHTYSYKPRYMQASYNFSRIFIEDGLKMTLRKHFWISSAN